jgi:alkylation response protein AidB-like acyl-CoA dehydrogenase
MELLLTDEQRMLQDSVRRTLAQAGGLKRTRGLRGTADGFEASVHARWAAEGWLGVIVPESRGGLGLGLTELALLAMEAGRVLAPEPIAISAVIAAIMADGEPGETRTALVEAVVGGDAIIVPVLGGGGGAPEVRARKSGSQTMLEGRVDGVALAPACSGFLFPANASDGPVLAYLARNAQGVSVRSSATVDGRPFGAVGFEAARADFVVTSGERAAKSIQSLYDLLLFASAAELAGVMEAALDMTVEYLKVRQQFGKPIGSFQALQHRAVDDLTSVISTRSFLFQVAAQGGMPSSAMASALKAHASGEALKVTKSAIQMHGGIGFTDEHDIGLYLKRAMWLSAYLGNAAFHRKRYASLTA